MSKRKFREFNHDEVGTNNLSNGSRSTEQEKLEGVLEHSKKVLSRALRIARGIERQKLGRRQKTAKESGVAEESSRLNAEVAALKAFDLSAKAELHLYKSIVKSKPIVSAPAFPAKILAIVETSRQPQDSAHANVQARLFNSSVVKEAMVNIMDSTRAALGIGNLDPARKKKRLRTADYASEKKPPRRAPQKNARSGETPVALEEDQTDPQSRVTFESLHEELSLRSSDDENVDLAAYEDRLADSENESTGESDLQISLPEQITLEHNPAYELSRSPSLSMSPPSSEIGIPRPRKVSTARPKTTTFLPSLAMGGYISESGSAISDPSSLAGNGNSTKPRKNRRGQQERRKIWEKKYGKNANHLKRPPARRQQHQHQQQQPQNRDEGWDARKGAAGGDDRGKRGRGRGRGRVGHGKKGGRGPISSGANTDPVQERRGGGSKFHDGSAKGTKTPAGAAASTALHPSWEAAKKRKEAKRNVAFEGKKVVFD
ncbi:hypothetical protein MMC07_007642 [Pseudocyphellaria aurata]|nr:hypothetical protein [Pseudocyphellaria aurata]